MAKLTKKDYAWEKLCTFYPQLRDDHAYQRLEIALQRLVAEDSAMVVWVERFKRAYAIGYDAPETYGEIAERDNIARYRVSRDMGIVLERLKQKKLWK